jgi:Phage integrase, N-terminal SAM-like domain
MPLTRTKVGDLTAHRRSFERSLRAGNKSPRTVETYLDALDQLCAFLAGRGMPTAAEAVTREHIEAYLVELLDLGRAPATVSNRFRALQQFWEFLVDEGDITVSPMARMTRARVPEQPIAVLSEDHLRALLSTCSGRSFEDVRDAAIIRLFVDTGIATRRTLAAARRSPGPRPGRCRRRRQGRASPRLSLRRKDRPSARPVHASTQPSQERGGPGAPRTSDGPIFGPVRVEVSGPAHRWQARCPHHGYLPSPVASWFMREGLSDRTGLDFRPPT